MTGFGSKVEYHARRWGTDMNPAFEPGGLGIEYLPSRHSRMGEVVAANDNVGPREAKPGTHAPQASTAWSIPEIRVVKDDQGRLRIDQSDPATYGTYSARQLLATAEAEPQYRDGMTKRPSAPSIKITYVNGAGEPQESSVRGVFCRMDGDALVLTKFETAEGEKVKDLPITVPLLGELDADVDDADRLHQIALAELGDVPVPAAKMEPEHEAARGTDSGTTAPDWAASAI